MLKLLSLAVMHEKAFFPDLNQVYYLSLTWNNKRSVLGGRVCGRVVSNLNVCSVAKCKYRFRICSGFLEGSNLGKCGTMLHFYQTYGFLVP